MILLDVNILVQAHREDADQHRAVRSWLEGKMSSPEGVGVSDLVLSGCLRVITHPKVFLRPTPLELALEFVRDFRDREEVQLLAPGKRHWGIFTKLCREGDARGNFVPDAYHAALAMEYGCTWFSLDRGFARFPGLVWRHPLEDI
ncbi:MAG: type II toxin-antitoxin system VapC family toxin [Blastochloris sp.]|nr:type II toxin-antitoxin system VapC family toxin [Blastochloris sp.]